jgi:RNA polymerase sigma-70 factor (ECF subfamily)
VHRHSIDVHEYNQSKPRIVEVIVMLIYLQLIETEEDKSKFEEIYTEYRNLMQYLAYKRLHNRQDAEDAVHQVFVKIAENIKTIEPISPKTKRLVVVMIENIVTDMLRKRGRHPNEEYWEKDLSIPVPELSEKDLLDACMWKLPEQQRLVIWLKYHDGYNLREIAGMMGITLVWAQKLDQRAKKRLLELYREGGGDL